MVCGGGDGCVFAAGLDDYDLIGKIASEETHWMLMLHEVTSWSVGLSVGRPGLFFFPSRESVFVFFLPLLLPCVMGGFACSKVSIA